jgi:TM2 domain-containing membrane protein YozV
MNRQYHRPLANISVYGISYLHRQNPFMVAWWSVIFPGFGQYMLNQYIRGTLFTLTEVIINTLAHINEAIVYSFCGDIEKAKSVLQTRWVYGYLTIYFYGMWSSYRSTVVQNEMCLIAEFENEPQISNVIHSLEIQYLEQKSPYSAAVYSFFFPGLGQEYNHRFGLGFYAMFWW